MIYSNTTNIPLSLAVFLASDSYDYNNDPYTISATTLIKPLRQMVLSARVSQQDTQIDLAQIISSRVGSAIHDAIERAWKKNYRVALTNLGFKEKVIDRIFINPTPEILEKNPDILPVYIEQRNSKKVGKYTISGKFDFVSDGRLEDFKTTTTYTAINNTNTEKYVLQGSLYKWLNPTIITRDELAIQWIFTDWSKVRAMSDPKYPQNRIQEKILSLMSLKETESYVLNKLSLIEKYWDTPEEEIPLCTDEDLWRSEPVYKYYKNPEKTARSTKNFDNLHDARIKYIEEGSTGLIKEVPGQVTACKYCSAFSVCTQKDSLIVSGDLVL